MARLIRGRGARLAVVAALGLMVGGGGYLAVRVLSAPGPRASPGWQLLTEMPSARGETAAAVADGRLFVIGGLSGLDFEASDHVSIYDAANEAWSAGPHLPEARHHAAAAAVDGTVYLSGGAASQVDGTPRGEVWALAPGAATWRQVASMPDGRFGHRLVALDGRLYAVGGIPYARSGAESGVEVLIYDIAADSWTKGSPIPLSRDHLAAVVVGQEIWAIGGRSGGLNVALVDIYDPATDRWANGPPLPEGTSGAAEAVIDGAIYISGGEDPSTGSIVDRHWRLPAPSAILDNFWTPLPIPPLAVHGASGAVLGGRFVIVAGATLAGSQSNTAWTGALQVFRGP